MPHFIVEYTANLGEEADIRGLLEKVHRVLIKRRDSFPIGGIRSRAIRLDEYYVADGAEDDAFVHATLKIGAGRPEQVKKEVGAELFAVMKDHFAPLFAKRRAPHWSPIRTCASSRLPARRRPAWRSSATARQR
ncbi:5-carboxymethyl-2-hydroxymuconate Delta-isomerase [Geobacillus thermoleovorans]|uniref:5-carboxymethyl-2-hydroxymuconate Delta-isomerase n=1 Tax=Geobacillus thermoleovorans TaxID=33941 RepID=UPI003D250110